MPRTKKPTERDVSMPVVPADQPDEAKPYWMGCLPGGPRECYTFGGHAFGLKTHALSMDPNQAPIPQPGCIAYLIPEQVEAIKKDVARYVVRKPSSKPGGRTFIANVEETREEMIPGAGTRVTKVYRPTRRDYPVAAHLYLLPWSERANYLGIGAELLQQPPTIADELELDIPAWVAEEVAAEINHTQAARTHQRKEGVMEYKGTLS